MRKKDYLRPEQNRSVKWLLIPLIVVFSLLSRLDAYAAFNVTVVGSDSNPVVGFRYTVEEDTTNLVVPGALVNDSIIMNIHNSYAPVLATGHSGPSDTANITLDGLKRYIVTVIPDSGYGMNGTAVPVGASSVTVTVHPLPLPTAQISIFAFVDQNPVSNTWDEHEAGLGGARVFIKDGAGQVSQDAFGNPLGTTYNPDGTVLALGDGSIMTLTQDDFNLGGIHNPYNLKVGEALVKYLVPGKYGVFVVPPSKDDVGNPIEWVQTSTIEGTKVVDAWVKANEPRLFVEGFGVGFNHTFFGFVKKGPVGGSPIKGQLVNMLPWNETPPAGTGSVSGTIKYNHFSRPPATQGFFPGPLVPKCWVALNDPVAKPGIGQPAGLYATACDGNSHFTIPNVPEGTYRFVWWDENLDALFGFNTVSVETGENVALGDVLAFRWFGTLNNYVFHDLDGDGFRDPGEPGIPEQNVNIRFRDGRIYQAFPTDLNGFIPFEEVFPFFKWLVAEVDFLRYKATGMTTAIDSGGAIPGTAWPANGNKNPQPQVCTAADIASGTVATVTSTGTDGLCYTPDDTSTLCTSLGQSIVNCNTGDNLSRTETGPVLTEAMHLFLNQTNLIEWGKKPYGPGKNGGITGIVFYAVTRAEDDPRYALGEPWEPGIPRVQVNLYQDFNGDGSIDDLDTNTGETLADVDNFPFQWAPMYQFLADGTTPNPAWTGIPGPEDVDNLTAGTFDFGDAIQITTTDSWDDNKPSGCNQVLPVIHGSPIPECADAFGTWNQVRPGVFDGGYAFNSYFPGGISSGSTELAGLPPGVFIIEAVPPHGPLGTQVYETVKEEDKNVDFGEEWKPSTLLLPPTCVGTVHPVPSFMTFDGTTPAPFAGTPRPLCDQKSVTVTEGKNAAADFFMFTDVPVSAQAVGFVNNDLGAEFNQASPNFGEKLAPSWLPISIQDWTGKELSRIYSDEFGGYNFRAPSTYTVNVPSPTGVSPNMLTIVINDPVKPDGSIDPFYDPIYSVTPWTLDFMPGATTYLDTPVVPMAAFSTASIRLDTDAKDGTPVISAVNGPSGGGPLVCDIILPNAPVTITSLGLTQIRNPAYDPSDPIEPLMITRDYGFGTTLGTVTLNGVSLTVTNWTDSHIDVSIPGGSTTGQLIVTRGDNGKVVEIGITLNIIDCIATPVLRVPSVYSTIQAAIDAATTDGTLILVESGAYEENVIMNKPVILQGYGAGSTIINGNPVPVDKLDLWHNRINALGGDQFSAFLLKNPFSESEAPGIIVFGETEYRTGNIDDGQVPPFVPKFFNPGHIFPDVTGMARIDGFKIIGSKVGGGIFATSGARRLTISNNEITNNQGNYAGGIAIGTQDSGFDAKNTNISIFMNKIHRCGGVQGGGGISMNEYSNNYTIEENLIIGNFSRFNGGGINHRGISPGTGTIRDNRVFFNEDNFGALLARAGDGGGIYVGGDVAGGTGAGNITIDGNLIQGNMTGSGYGGGIRAFAINAQDVLANPSDPTQWNELRIVNNVIVNNVSGMAGAGISLQDVARATIANNTIANNDATSTSALAFTPGMANSNPQPAGVVSAEHSDLLEIMFGTGFEQFYSDPVLVNNIIWHNRSWFNDASLNSGAGGLAQNPAGPYWDLNVIESTTPTDRHLSPANCVLSSQLDPVTGFDYGASPANLYVAPAFFSEYFNTLETATVLDEGGNAIFVRFTPISLTDGTGTFFANYHIQPDIIGNVEGAGSGSLLATIPELGKDIDGEDRPNNTAANNVDIGADEVYGSATPLMTRNPVTPVNPGTPLIDPINPGSPSGNIIPGTPTKAGPISPTMHTSEQIKKKVSENGDPLEKKSEDNSLKGRKMKKKERKKELKYLLLSE